MRLLSDRVAKAKREWTTNTTVILQQNVVLIKALGPKLLAQKVADFAKSYDHLSLSQKLASHDEILKSLSDESKP